MSNPGFKRSALVIGLVSAVVVAGFVRLGFWQLDRAGQKQQAHALFERNSAKAPVDIGALLKEPETERLWREVEARGGFVDGINVVLDNQSLKGRPGYYVFAPFRLGDGATVILINRGWMPNDGRRDELSVPPLPVDVARIRGRAGKPPSAGIRIAGDDQIERINDQLYRVQQIDFDNLSRTLRQPLEPLVMLQETDTGEPLRREWSLPASDEARHRSYAVQWFAMAAALTLINLGLLARARA